MEKTKKIDVFNSTPRKIKCITNEMDYLGDALLDYMSEIIATNRTITFNNGETYDATRGRSR